MMKIEKDNMIRNVEKLYETAQTDIQNKKYSNGLISILKAQEMINVLKNNKISLKKHLTLQSDIFFTKGYLYQNHFSLSTQALANFLSALKIAENNKLKKKAVNCYLEIGNLYKKQQKYKKAIDFYLKIIDFDQSYVSLDIQSIILEEIAEIYFAQREYETSYSYYQKALQSASKYGELNQIITLKYKIGKLLYLQDEPSKSLEILLHLIKSTKDNLEPLIILIYSKIASCYINLKDNIEAEKYADKVISNAEKINDKNILMEIFKDISLYYEKICNYKDSFKYIKKVKEVTDVILNSATEEKLKNIQTVFDLESKEKEAELSGLRNVELVKANKLLKTHREHLHLVNKILRHDIINNLTAIRSSIRIYRTDKKKDILINCENYINKSFDLINRMKQMEYFLSANSVLKVFDLSEIFKIIIKNYNSIKIKTIGNAQILADDALLSVFDNIISNAKIHGKADKIEISVLPDNNFCEIRIADNGIGIPENIREKVFEENFVYGSTGHTGLGLYIVKKNVLNYQGTVHIEDNIPKGTTFVIKLKKAD